jgi:hypothetical protein
VESKASKLCNPGQTVHGATTRLRPIFNGKTGIRSVRYLTLHTKFISSTQAVQALPLRVSASSANVGVPERL